MDTIETVMSYLADMRERGDDRAKDLFQALADLPEPEFEAPEGHHTTKAFTSEDCDHGLCIGRTFDNGWVMYTYVGDLARVSFHKLDDAPDEPCPLKTYEVFVKAEVSQWVTVSALDEDSADEQAYELFQATVNADVTLNSTSTSKTKEITHD